MWTLVLAAVLAAGPAVAQNSVKIDPEYVLPKSMVSEAMSLAWGSPMAMITLAENQHSVTDANDEAVRQIAKTGAICRVFGHRWDGVLDCYVDNVQAVPAVYTWPSVTWTQTQPQHRQCSVCGRREVRSEEWREEK